MQASMPHAWDLSTDDAKALQRSLSAKVVREDRLGDVRCVAGVDVAYDEDGGWLFAAVAVLDSVSLELLEVSTARQPVAFPYVSGLLAFRELPAVIEAMGKLRRRPDLTICDGQGRAHPRRFGLACHLGVWFDLPTVGCSKTRLTGQADPVGSGRGARALLMDKGEVVGSVLRTRDGIRPVYVSTGHRVSLQTACDWVLKLTPVYRLPETTRQADRIVRGLKREFINERHLQ